MRFASFASEAAHTNKGGECMAVAAFILGYCRCCYRLAALRARCLDRRDTEAVPTR